MPAETNPRWENDAIDAEGDPSKSKDPQPERVPSDERGSRVADAGIQKEGDEDMAEANDPGDASPAGRTGEAAGGFSKEVE